jgi:hypothetical protein
LPRAGYVVSLRSQSLAFASSTSTVRSGGLIALLILLLILLLLLLLDLLRLTLLFLLLGLLRLALLFLLLGLLRLALLFLLLGLLRLTLLVLLLGLLLVALLLLLLILLLVALLVLLLLPVLVLLLIALRCIDRGLIRPTRPLWPFLSAWRYDHGRLGRFYLVWHALPLLIAEAEGLRIAQSGRCRFVCLLANPLGLLQPDLGLLLRHRPYLFQYLCLRLCALGDPFHQAWHLFL